jgi:hypothetical protein
LHPFASTASGTLVPLARVTRVTELGAVVEGELLVELKGLAVAPPVTELTVALTHRLFWRMKGKLHWLQVFPSVLQLLQKMILLEQSEQAPLLMKYPLAHWEQATLERHVLHPT